LAALETELYGREPSRLLGNVSNDGPHLHDFVGCRRLLEVQQPRWPRAWRHQLGCSRRCVRQCSDVGQVVDVLARRRAGYVGGGRPYLYYSRAAFTSRQNEKRVDCHEAHVTTCDVKALRWLYLSLARDYRGITCSPSFFHRSAIDLCLRVQLNTLLARRTYSPLYWRHFVRSSSKSVSIARLMSLSFTGQ
jgi:hypothetical protein